MMSRFRRKPRHAVTVAGETFVPEPLDLEQTLELALILAPYLALVEEHWAEFKQALQNTSGRRPRILSAMFFGLSDQIRPEDISKVFVLLLGKPQDWTGWPKARPAELINTLSVLDDINHFYDLFTAAQGLGFTARYKRGMDDAGTN